MNQTVTAVFDGKVLHPDSALDLKPNSRYVIVVQELSDNPTQGNVWDVLDSLTGSVEAPEDWAEEHDHYLYGTAKQKKSK